MKKLPIFTIALIVLFCFVHAKKARWTNDYGAWKNVVSGDGYGYWSYLPALVIHHNLDFNGAINAVRKISPEIKKDQVITYTIFDLGNNKQLNKCFVGIAIILLPFFLLACLYAKIFGYDVDGFSYPFQLSVGIAALFYLFVGLFYLYKLLKLYDVKDLIICFTLIIVVFATNLYYYATKEPSMPHIYDFSLIAVFLYYAKKAMLTIRLKYLLLMAVSLGILIMIRPPNVLIVLAIPFLAGSLKSTGDFILKLFKTKGTIIASIVLLAIVSLQFIMWHAQSGKWFVWSYPGEGFNFNDPHFIDILFSYRKGWFLYTPVMFFMIVVASFVFIKKDVFRFFSLAILFTVITYVFSSWWYWAYGGSFGSRPFIDYYAFFAFAFALSVNMLNLSWWYKIPGVVIGILCLYLNLLQTRQYENFILLYDGMDKAKYWKVFLHTGVEYIGCFDVKEIQNDYDFMEKYTLSNDFENNKWGNDNNVTCAYAHSGTHSAFSNSTLQYSPGYIDSVGHLPQPAKGKLSVYTEFWVYMPDKNNDARLIVALQEKDNPSYFWHNISIPEIVDSCNKWTKIEDAVELPDFKSKNDRISIYVLNPKGIVYIDDVVIKFGTHK